MLQVGYILHYYYIRSDSINIAIMTCENYNCTDANSVEREQERRLSVKDLSKINYDPERSNKNIILEHDKEIDRHKTFKEYVRDYKEREDITGRFNIDTVSDRNATKVLSCFVMSGSRNLIATMTRTEQVYYFRNGLEFLKQEYPTFHLVDARIHYDEKGLPHMHASFLPIHERENGDRVFNVSQCQKGRDYFKGFQDRFYDFMRERFPEKCLERTDPEQEHRRKMSVREYKENKDFEREIEQERQRLLAKNEKLKDIEQQMNEAYEEQEKAQKHLREIERYCERMGLSMYQYEKQCFMADRGYCAYPAPERYNPERQQEHEIEREPDRSP